MRRWTVTFGNVASPVLEAGPETEEAAVFVHGNPGSSRDWDDLLPRVGVFGRAIAIDMPGFGQADKPDDFEYTIPGYARHLDGVLRELGVRRAHLVLHDFGGAWGLAWAAQQPDRLGSLTLINIGVMSGYRWHYMAKIWRTPLLGELSMAVATRSVFTTSLRHGNPRGLPREFVNRMYDDFDAGTRRAVLRLYRASNPGGEIAQKLAQVFRALDPPTLVVWGKHDPYVPVRFAEQQRDVFPRAKVVILEDSGHWPFADDPDAVAREVVPFLREQFRAGDS